MNVQDINEKKSMGTISDDKTSDIESNHTPSEEKDVLQRYSNLQYIFSKHRRPCPLRKVPIKDINYKNVQLLVKYVSERGRILPSRITAISAKKQRALSRAIKASRLVGFMPYVRR